MKNSIIWFLSNNNNFPIEIWKHPNFDIKVKQIPLTEFESINFQAKEFNLLFLYVSHKEWSQYKSKWIPKIENSPQLLHTLIASRTEQEIPREKFAKSNIDILSTPLQLVELRMIINWIITAELYKYIALEIGENCMEKMAFFDGLFSLAHNENRDSEDTVKALQSILDYEGNIKLFNESVNQAMTAVNSLKDNEMIELKERIIADELLDNLRSRELKDALEINKAMEEALLFSRSEGIHKDQVIRAHERIFQYTDEEIRKLYIENQELKKRLDILDKE